MTFRVKHVWTPTWIGFHVDEQCIHCDAKRSTVYGTGQLVYDTALDPIYCGASVFIPSENTFDAC